MSYTRGQERLQAWIDNVEIKGRFSMASCTPTGNLALNQAVTSSKDQSGYPAANVVDGTDNTDANRWSVLGYGNWVEVDLGSVLPIDRVEIKPFNSRGYQYRVSVATTQNGTYTTVADESSNQDGNRPLLTTSFDAANARYVRFTITGCSGSKCSSGAWVALREVKVYGCSNAAGARTATQSATKDRQPEVAYPEAVVVYPNPSDQEFTFYYPSSEASQMSLRIYDTKGTLVAAPPVTDYPSGERRFVWEGNDQNGRAASTGLYLYRIVSRSENSTTTRSGRIMLQRE